MVTAILQVDDVDGDKPITHELGAVQIPIHVTLEESVGAWLDNRWYEWREESPHPDSYALFVNWLVEKHGCKVREGIHIHTFDVR